MFAVHSLHRLVLHAARRKGFVDEAADEARFADRVSQHADADGAPSVWLRHRKSVKKNYQLQLDKEGKSAAQGLKCTNGLDSTLSTRHHKSQRKKMK